MFATEKTKFSKLYLIFAAVALVIVFIGETIASAVSAESFAIFLASIFSYLYSTKVLLIVITAGFAVAVLNGKDSEVSNKVFVLLTAIIAVIVICDALHTYLYAIYSSVKFDSCNAAAIVLDTFTLIDMIVFLVLSKFFPIAIETCKENVGCIKCNLKEAFAKCKKTSTETTTETAEKPAQSDKAVEAEGEPAKAVDESTNDKAE